MLAFSYLDYENYEDKVGYRLIKYIWSRIPAYHYESIDDLYSFYQGEKNTVTLYVRDSVRQGELSGGDIERICNEIIEEFNGDVILDIKGYEAIAIGFFKEYLLRIDVTILSGNEILNTLLRLKGM